MTEALEVVGLASGVTAGFLVAAPLGCAVMCVACLWAAWQRARRSAQ